MFFRKQNHIVFLQHRIEYLEKENADLKNALAVYRRPPNAPYMLSMYNDAIKAFNDSIKEQRVVSRQLNEEIRVLSEHLLHTRGNTP